jgi:hypothetical protein
MYKAPLLPTLELPVLRIITPLTPEVPAFAVCSNNAPLLDVVPRPLLIDTSPPVADEDAPAANAISPPDPLLPDPTVKYTAPPRPRLAAPDPMLMEPLLPDKVVPDPT